MPAVPNLIYYTPITQHIECTLQYKKYSKEFVSCELTPMEPVPSIYREQLKRSWVEMAEECYNVRQRYVRVSRIVRRIFETN